MPTTGTIPKSLHTVTVLVRLARLLARLHPHATHEGLVGLAVIELGYVAAADTHGLAAAALKVMSK